MDVGVPHIVNENYIVPSAESILFLPPHYWRFAKNFFYPFLH